MIKNLYLISNTYKSFYLFRKEIILELSRRYNLILVANEDSYSDFFLNGGIKCVKFNNLFNNKNIFANLNLVFQLLILFLKKKPHLVQTYTIHPNLIIPPIAKIFFAKTIVMITGMGSLSISNHKFVKLIYNIFYKFSSIFTDYFIFVNNHNREYFVKKLKISKPFIQIYGAGIIIKKKFRNYYLKNKYNLNNSFNILFIGRLIEEKGFYTAIKVFKRINIKNKKLIIVGDFDKMGFSKKINKSILTYPHIVWIKNLNDISQIMYFSNLFLFPSRTEGMPTVLMEAINYNLPTVTYSIPGSEDIIKHNMNGFIHKVGDLRGLENSILKIYNSKNNFFKKNYNNLIVKFDRNKIKNKVIKFYDKILNK